MDQHAHVVHVEGLDHGFGVRGSDKVEQACVALRVWYGVARVEQAAEAGRLVLAQEFRIGRLRTEYDSSAGDCRGRAT